MIRKKIPKAFVVALLSGALMSFIFIHPYQNKILLSDLILQFSGARGNLQLGISLNELLLYSVKIMPCLVFEMYIGTYIYGDFCTASIYIFSRTTNRLRWYFKECFIVLILAAIFQSVMVVFAVIITGLRYHLIVDKIGVLLVIIHIAIYWLWIFSMALLINLISLIVGSEFAFIIVAGGQCMLITLLSALRLFEKSISSYSLAVRINPISHLIVGWHSIAMDAVIGTNYPLHTQLSLSFTFVYLFVIALFILLIGSIMVYKYDFLVTDAEFGGA